MSGQDSKFDAKVAELVALCRPLEVRQIMLVRRMTMIDPESLKWATAKQLEAVFTVILTDALQRIDPAELEIAADKQFEPMLPPGSDEANDDDRWLLYRLSRPFLAAATAAPAVIGPVLPSTEPVPLEEEDEGTVTPFAGFAAMFDDTICRYLRRSVAALAVNLGLRPHTPPPFYLTPAFSQAFEDAMRRIVFRQMRNNRVIKDLGESRDWAKSGNARLISMIQSDARDNPIHHHWDARWDAFRPGAPPVKGKVLQPEDTPWPEWAEHGASNTYLAPKEKDLWLLKKMLRWNADSITEGWSEVAQLYIQEFNPANKYDKLRDGAFRDGLVKWIDRLPAHAGEALAAKAFFECPKCDRIYLRKVVQSFGMERDQRKRVPLLCDFLDNLPK